MNNTLRQLYNIEPNQKINKLLEELQEQTDAIKDYVINETDENMIRAIEEYIDTGAVLLQLAIIKHDIQLEEVKSMVQSIMKINLRIAVLIRESNIDYKAARKIVRG
jgi:hypothetical protein